MNDGDIVRGFRGWLALVIGKKRSKKGESYISIIWQSGPLRGKRANVSKSDLKRVVVKPESGFETPEDAPGEIISKGPAEGVTE